MSLEFHELALLRLLAAFSAAYANAALACPSAIRCSDSRSMKPAPFRYHAPGTIDEVIGLLDGLEDARVLAGGQSLMPMMNMRIVQPAHIIDINRVEGLSYIRRRGEVLEVGAMTRQRDIEFSDVVKEAFPLMHEAVQQIGHRQTRNRGTLGGSLCQLDPRRSLLPWPQPSMRPSSSHRRPVSREIPFADFPLGLMSPPSRRTSWLPPCGFRCGGAATALLLRSSPGGMVISR